MFGPKKPHNAGFVIAVIPNNRCYTLRYFGATGRKAILINLNKGGVGKIKGVQADEKVTSAQVPQIS